MKPKKILLVEDEQNFGAVLKNYLELSGYAVEWVTNGKLGYSKFKSNSYDLCILDVMMPEKDGFTLAGEIRKDDNEIPLIFLTAKGEKQDQVKGYKIGADDYLTKPFDTELLILKIQRLLERTNSGVPAFPEKIIIGDYTFYPLRRILALRENNTRLSPKENQLLEMLCRYPNTIMSRELALNEIWQKKDYFTARSMDVYIAKLRKRLNKDNRIEIENVHSTGYVLHVPEIKCRSTQ